MIASPYILMPLLLFIAYLTSRFAIKKNRDPYFWFGLGFLFGILAPLILTFLPRVVKKEDIMDQIPLDLTPKSPEPPFPHMDWYYLDQSHQQIGPLSFQLFKDAYEAGHIQNDSYIWNDSMTEWVVLSTKENILETLKPEL
ncbi:MAG: GYF domain-containing protein [Simkaniaceae bacterium]|nr:GYF domain-containing protein [Simkaniaceae bacterium]MCF7851672.1 GYF domain-containing protein [Simkaniaceae bacterium]